MVVGGGLADAPRSRTSTSYTTTKKKKKKSSSTNTATSSAILLQKGASSRRRRSRRKGGGSISSGSSSTKRSPLQRIAVCGLLTIVWSWIMVTFGMVFYHGYYIKRNKKSAGGGGPLSPSSVVGGGAGGPAVGAGAAAAAMNSPGGTGGEVEGPIQPYKSPLLMFTCNRDEYLRKTLDDILQYIPNDCSIGCPIVISQDGIKQEVIDVIQQYTQKFKQQVNVPVVHLKHKSALRGGKNAYQALAVHYGWALRQVFDDQNAIGTTAPDRVLILEEDLHVAPDFFQFFKKTAPILDHDPTLFAVSAFNDNGYEGRVKDPARILRSDFFPGLGWMMTRKLWQDELRAKWPNGYWDDWLRDPDQRKNRQVLRPEISRTFHFGVEGGASANQFGGKLSRVLLNPTPTDWNQIEDLSYLLQVHNFDRMYWNAIHSAQHVTSVSEAKEKVRDTNVQMDYTSLREFKHLANQLGLMDDEKAGIVRTSYKGIVETRLYGNYQLYITPPINELQKEFADVI